MIACFLAALPAWVFSYKPASAAPPKPAAAIGTPVRILLLLRECDLPFLPRLFDLTRSQIPAAAAEAKPACAIRRLRCSGSLALLSLLVGASLMYPDVTVSKLPLRRLERERRGGAWSLMMTVSLFFPRFFRAYPARAPTAATAASPPSCLARDLERARDFERDLER